MLTKTISYKCIVNVSKNSKHVRTNTQHAACCTNCSICHTRSYALTLGASNIYKYPYKYCREWKYICGLLNIVWALSGIRSLLTDLLSLSPVANFIVLRVEMHSTYILLSILCWTLLTCIQSDLARFMKLEF